MELTNLEIAYLNNIARCEYNFLNGDVPKCADDVSTYAWPDERAEKLGISEHALGGVVSSLIKKELINILPASTEEEDDSVYFTDTGFQVWDAHPEADKD